jgi:two-component system, chemotaxis family, CheB/CheR fusion protein
VTDPDEFGSDDAFEALLVHLREHCGFDFTGYKRASLRRRIQRRMTQAGVSDYPDYLDRLQVDADEFAALFNTILINVTGFFRDPDTWSFLRAEVLPKLVAQRPEGVPLRVWSAGCASGQEAYSLAIVLAEVLGVDRFRREVKIYATDVDEDALRTARHAAYTDSELSGLPAELRESYFEPQGRRWSFRSDLRRSVIFGRNDLVQDAPISRIDILACRNTLMYFTGATQSAIMSRIQFALNPNGLLLLGRAEMLLNHSRNFEPVDLGRRIFRKIAVGSTPGAGSTLGLERRADTGPLEQLRVRAFHNVPVAQLVLTEDDTVAMINHQAETMFGVGSRDVGRPLRDLVLSYRPVELRAAIERARLDRATQRLTEVSVEQPDREPLWFEVQITPLVDDDDRLLGTSVSYHDVTTTHRLVADLERTNTELTAAYEELQSTGEELETTNEELQSTVEELETTNEELQSTNEELETMNEELRSTNDELQQIAQSADDRSHEVGRLNDFLGSILGSLQSVVVALDTEMRVTVWNDRAEEYWGLRSDEVLGQHLLNLDIGLPVEQLHPAIRATLTESADPANVHLSAINRRGQTIEVRVMATALRSNGQVTGTILLIE